ncbi:hypothetical protein K469DRAFT_704980 [Zopfia rhizophila CBS 207.26]|uniref:Uncharacterized protein n=1 Tax=Zopfia rhizophila CBS 207.26 TaxID=1314779 RepID=A0A6A6E831_9PEZI|nr:hypothetical protein K469DRAFT_704980 [Zopfia rhizophila CBS 207.26]
MALLYETVPDSEHTWIECLVTLDAIAWPLRKRVCITSISRRYLLPRELHGWSVISIQNITSLGDVGQGHG